VKSNQIVSDTEMEECLHWLCENDGTMADAHTNCEIAEQKRKRLIALLMKDFEGSISSREMNALASPKYGDFLEGEYRDAINNDQRLKLKAKVMNTKIDVYRTISANQRRG
jgi:siderophore synthetase component